MLFVRYIFLFILGLFGIWWLRRKVGGDQRASREQDAKQTRLHEPERITACAHCGLHVPESEGVIDGGYFYCSQAHRALGPKA